MKRWDCPVNQSDPFGLCPTLNLNLSDRELLHIGLGIAAMIPGIGAICSGIDAALYFQEGNYVEGLISMAGCIAGVGKAITTIAKVGKVSCTAFKVGMVMRAVGTGYVAGAMARYSIDFAKDAYQAWKDNGEEWSPEVVISLAQAAVCAVGAVGAIAELGNCVGEMAEVAGKGMACFIAGTQVLTDEGLKNIEDIQAGDYVYSTDEETGESGYKEVVNTFAKETEVLTHVRYELKDQSLSEYEEYYPNKKSDSYSDRGKIENKESNGNHENIKRPDSQEISEAGSNEIITTMNHRFWCEGVWKAAGTLEEGDILTLADGTEAVVTSVTFEAKHTTVYNMEVADYHTYYVGEDSVLVHNMCGTTGSPVGEVIEDGVFGAPEVVGETSYGKSSINYKNSLDYLKDIENINGKYYADKKIIDEIGQIEARGEDFSRLNKSIMSSRASTEGGTSIVYRYSDEYGTKYMIHEVTNADGYIIHRDFDAVRISSGQIINKGH